MNCNHKARSNMRSELELHDINIMHKLGITKFPMRKFSYERQNLVIKINARNTKVDL